MFALLWVATPYALTLEIMKVCVLSHQHIRRLGSSSNGCTIAERDSSDFLVNGESLLCYIVKAVGGHSDFMGCFVKGFSEQNEKTTATLLALTEPDSESGRVALYVCPECGDIGCGAYSVRVEKTRFGYIWRDFAYENGYEEPRTIDDVGPFSFEKKAYEDVIISAAAI